MARLHAVPLPIDSDFEMLEIVQELSRVACVQRSFVEVQQEEIVVHFESMDDAVFFLDNLAFLLSSLCKDFGIAKSGEVSSLLSKT